MFGVFMTIQGRLVWIATSESEEEAEDIYNKTVLNAEDVAFVVPLTHFRQAFETEFTSEVKLSDEGPPA